MTSTPTSRTVVRGGALAALLLALGGCNVTTLDNFPTTAEVVERGALIDRGHTLAPGIFQRAANARAEALLAEPLSLDAALEIAMLNAPSLQRIYTAQEVDWPSLVEDIAAARQAQAGKVPVEWTALRVALLPLANRKSRYDFSDEYMRLAPAFIETAEHVRISWYKAVAANQVERMMRSVVDALKAQAELANEQYRAGTASRGEQAKRHLALGSAIKEHAEAQRELIEAREELIRDLGLWGSSASLTLPDRLPDLPADAPKLEGLEDFALKNRMDIVHDRKHGGAWTQALKVRSQVRESHANLLLAYDTAKYQRDVVMPLVQTSLTFAQQEYNGMLIGVYDLLDEVHEQIEAGKDYVETLRDYWIAEAELTGTLGGSLPQQSL